MNINIFIIIFLIACSNIYSSDNNSTSITVLHDRNNELYFTNYACSRNDLYYGPQSIIIEYKSLNLKDTNYDDTFKMTPVVLLINNDGHGLLFVYKKSEILLPFAALLPKEITKLQTTSLKETPVFNISSLGNSTQKTNATNYYPTRIIKKNWGKNSSFGGQYGAHFSLPSLINTKAGRKFFFITFLFVTSVISLSLYLTRL